MGDVVQFHRQPAPDDDGGRLLSCSCGCTTFRAQVAIPRGRPVLLQDGLVECTGCGLMHQLRDLST